MKQRFYLFCRRGTYYLQDSRTGKQQSLETKNRAVATRLLEAKRQLDGEPGFNQFLLRTCLSHSDPMLIRRTWGAVMDEMATHGRESTRTRCSRAIQCRAFRSIRDLKLVETRAEDFLAIMKPPKASVVHYLKRLHNLALGFGWLSFPVLAPRLWPRPEPKPRRGITLAEHQSVLDAEPDRERKLFYQLLWEIGAAQSDAAALTSENLDWATNCLTYSRMKTGETAQLAIGTSLAALLKQLPQSGPLFPKISKLPNRRRSADFFYRCKAAKVSGVSLHSYRYAWAERAKTCGYPERFAQQALGHNSKAVHRAYAKRALVIIPPMENYSAPTTNVLATPFTERVAAA